MIGTVKSLILQTYQKWNAHDTSTLGAAIAYYTVLSLAPLLVIAVSIAGLAFHKDAVQQYILGQATVVLGSAGAEAVRAMLSSGAGSPKQGVVAALVGGVVLIFGAS